MEMNSLLDWAILFSVVQLCVWQIVHVRKSVTTWKKFKKIEDVQKENVMINVSLYNRIVSLEKEVAQCQRTDTVVKS